ncbi:hypothetical protein BWQ96_09560 [Gracilariopsis chorda]|uniref:Uncharacterized protein n=1 Tax=Gracilariopsis chorda TaxID=448386 RepID=A0A2V3IF83_9FLOR|nr:hypothetical protein BWQ96_09560 [Gracilariopsis chorda]|eukprot:PXF40727.1 hypothetical protein BWQ96_09560 [Gracilariopsis chorda]
MDAAVAIPIKRYPRFQPSSSNDAPLSDDSNDSSTPRRGNPKYSVVSPDLAIANKLSDEPRSRISPASQNIRFRLNHPPQFVLESSSTNKPMIREKNRKCMRELKYPYTP